MDLVAVFPDPPPALLVQTLAHQRGWFHLGGGLDWAELAELGDSDPELSDAIREFQAEELEHRDMLGDEPGEIDFAALGCAHRRQACESPLLTARQREVHVAGGRRHQHHALLQGVQAVDRGLQGPERHLGIGLDGLEAPFRAFEQRGAAEIGAVATGQHHGFDRRCIGHVPNHRLVEGKAGWAEEDRRHA